MSVQISDSDRVKDYWANAKLAFSDMSSDDAKMLLKCYILQSINLNWELGFSNLTRLEMLKKAFPEDNLIAEIYDQLLERCNENIKDLDDVGCRYIYENCFSDQPETFRYGGESYMHLYDVHNDWMLKKLFNKYPKLKNIMLDVIYK